jgi:hypothetical protein
MRSVQILFTLAAAAVLAGCEAQAHAVPKSTEATSRPTVETLLPPLRGVIGIDESGSMATAKVAPVTVATLAPIFERLKISGGELAIAFITDQSNSPLLRLYVPQPPDPPVFQRASGNIFEKAAEKRREEQQNSSYATEYRAWRSEASARVNAFSIALGDRLEHPRQAPNTDLSSAVSRANLFLSEPIVYSRAPENLAIFITDGIDTVNATSAPTISVPADVFIVNGTGTVAYLAALNPARFESLEAALRVAIPEGGRNVR